MSCMCGDTACPSCGTAQGTYCEHCDSEHALAVLHPETGELVEIPCPACCDGADVIQGFRDAGMLNYVIEELRKRKPEE